MRRAQHHRYASACALIVALLSVVLVVAPAPAQAQGTSVVINEVVAANDSYVDNFGDTPDWIELQNNGNSAINLNDWSIADDGGPWIFPSVNLAPGARLVVFASGRDLSSGQLHTDFSLKRAGETITLANSDGQLVDSMVYPELDDDRAYGRGPSGGIGVLLSPTPGSSNSALAPSGVTITTPAQTFIGTVSVSMTGTTRPGEQVRYTTNSTPVTSSSPVYNGPITLTTSTVVRAAVVGNGVTGPESSAGYIAVSTSIENFTSDLPMVIVHSTGAVGDTNQDAIVSVIDRGVDGRAGVFDHPDYMGFAGLRVRGNSSSNFPKKQYKFELWGDRLGDEVDADLLGLGGDSDWVLYAPGYHDQAMINNPFMYELGKRIGVLSPDYQFVELYIEDNPSATVGDGDYLGVYVLRETIKIDDERVDITEHPPTSAGPDGGYILRYDWNDSCCRNIKTTRFGSRVAVDAPGQDDLTDAQFNHISNWWNDLESAAGSSFTDVDQYIDFDSFIDQWLLEILAMDVDVLRASHFFHLDAGGQLQGGPLWDYDRSLGARDSRVDEISEARAWKPNGNSGHTYLSDVYEDLWGMPEVQARLRARWAELRAPGAEFSNAELETLIFAMGGEIAEAYVREEAKWGSVSGYGPRFGSYNGELNHMRDWVFARTAWLDGQFLNSQSPPVVTLPAGGLQIQANVAVSYQVQATDAQTMFFSADGLPEGLTIDSSTGLISGVAAYGDTYGEFPVTITVSDSGGASTSGVLLITDRSTNSHGTLMVLNEYNAVAPGQLLDLGGTDSFFGSVQGNGGDWFEVVTIGDNLDLRGWTFDVWSNNDDGDVVQTASLILGNNNELADVRAGSIMTVAESVPDDLSYDPDNDDWTLQLQANNAQGGAWWSNQTNFDTNHKKWRLVIRDAFGGIAGYIGGETEVFRADGSNVKSGEVLVLDDDPNAAARQYAASAQSTFGAPNLLSGGGVQDFSSLRPELVLMGDVSCDGFVDVGDALVVAQFSVGTRTDSAGCPLTNPTTQINSAAADVDEDGFVTVGDALLIAQCSVGLLNQFCPE